MNYLRVLFIVIFLGSVASYAEELKFGIVSTQENVSCISFGKSYPPKNSEIKVVSSDEKQFYVEGKVGNLLAKCSSLEKAQIEGPYFEFVTPQKLYAPFIGMAVFGQNKIFSENGIVYLTNNGLKDKIYFRACTSNEGLHLFSWLGVPLQGKQIWHQYFYLGYDVEPSCEENDFQEPKT